MNVRCVIDGSRADIVISRPGKRNAITSDMMREIVELVGAAGTDDDVKVIVLRAEGEVFTAGFDITNPTDFTGGNDEPVRARISSLQEKSGWMRNILHADKPMIAQVRGCCVGIGTMLVLVADFAIVADNAAFGFPEERLGSAGASWAYPFLALSIGLKQANEMMLTGRRLGAAEALGFGLVNAVVAGNEMEAATDELARAISSLPRDGIAVNRVTKKMLLATLGYDSCFGIHAAVHPLAERIERSPDEYDFMKSVESNGVRAAVEERNAVFGERWWRW